MAAVIKCERTLCIYLLYCNLINSLPLFFSSTRISFVTDGNGSLLSLARENNSASTYLYLI